LLGHTVHTRAERLMNLSEISYYENGVSDGCAHTTVWSLCFGILTNRLFILFKDVALSIRTPIISIDLSGNLWGVK
jgi:hypothetical protein